MVYGLGMCKFIVFNIGFIGCVFLVFMFKSLDGYCVLEVDVYVIGFNMVLKFLLEEF